jgi:hypothetical protein
MRFDCSDTAHADDTRPMAAGITLATILWGAPDQRRIRSIDTRRLGPRPFGPRASMLKISPKPSWKGAIVSSGL